MPPKDATAAAAATQPMLFKDIPSFLDGLNGLDVEGYKTLSAMGQLFSTLHARFDLKEAKARDGLATLSTLITSLTNNNQSTTIKKDHPAYCSAVSLCRHLDASLQEYAASVDTALPSDKGRPFQMQRAFIVEITGTTDKKVKDFETTLFKELGLSSEDIKTAENYTRSASANVCPPADTDPATFDSLRKIMLKYVFACELARDTVLRNNSGVMNRFVRDFKKAIENQYVSTRERMEGRRADRNYLSSSVLDNQVDIRGFSTRQLSSQLGTSPMETKIYSQVPAYLRSPPSYPQPQVAAAYGALNTTSMARVEYLSPFAANNQHLLEQQLIQQQLLQIQQQTPTTTTEKNVREWKPPRGKRVSSTTARQWNCALPNMGITTRSAGSPQTNTIPKS